MLIYRPYLYIIRKLLIINLEAIQMGSTCKKTESVNQKTSMKIIKNEKYFGNIEFNFSTEKISRINCECMILFTDPQLKVKKNKYLNQVGVHTAEKIQEYFDANIVGEKLLPGSAVVFQIDMRELSFQYICILCLGVWGGASHISQPLEIALEKALHQVKQAACKKIAITEIDEEYGIPVEVAYDSITKAIYAQRTGVESIVYLCDSLTDQEEGSGAIMKFQPAQEVDQGRRTSIYY